MDISIIIVNWNSAQYVRKCLDSIYAPMRDTDFEVIVVDNGSFDSCEAIIKREFPSAHFLQNRENAGFAGANNFGATVAKGELLLFLNPDTEVIDGALTEMMAVFKSMPDAGVVGCKLLNTDMTLQISCIQPYPTILNQALDSDFFCRRFPGLWGRGSNPILAGNSGPVEVQAVSGACMMIKKEIFEEVGRFSEEYFMYSEDIDLCFKVRQSGHKNYFAGSASVIHHGGGSSYLRKENFFGTVQMRESIFKFLKKNRGRLYASLYRSLMFFTGILRLCMLALAFIPCMVMGSANSCRASLVKWAHIIRWAAGGETWAK
ncbi:MAG: glycosyltransferase family 2 protein [Nitrospiraceae bacterium]|nr:glycosyltransferase family 2 protein [Nitrospiraceae bacterium]